MKCHCISELVSAILITHIVLQAIIISN